MKDAGKKEYAIKRDKNDPKVIVEKKHAQTQIKGAPKQQRQVLRQPLPLQEDMRT